MIVTRSGCALRPRVPGARTTSGRDGEERRVGGWINVGLGAAAALCPLPQHGDVTVVMDHDLTGHRLVVCAPDVSVDMGYGDEAPEPHRPACTPPSPPVTPPPVVRPSPAPPSPSAPEPGPTPAPTPHRTPGRVLSAPPEAAPAPALPAPPAPSPRPEPAPPSDPAPSTAPAPPRPAEAPQAFRWVPRSHYTGGPARPAPARLSMTMSTVVVTLPAVLAAAALRPGSRRRGRG